MDCASFHRNGKQLKSVRNSKSRRLINDAKNIVANRYMEEDLSLDKVCSIMGVSNSYFSSIFKKETGISFVSYLTDYRMDIAAKLILDTNEKSYKIGEMVGYMDANYFSYVFKKKFGISPSKYRNAKIKVKQAGKILIEEEENGFTKGNL